MATKQRSVRLDTATGNRVLRAFAKTARRIVASKRDISKASSAAGFVIPSGQPRGQRRGYQVFVTLIAFDEALLIDNPESGGLQADL